MRHFDATNAELTVHTTREGVLSPVGHDLELAASTLSLDVDEATNTLELRIDPRAMHVRGALIDGALDTTRLSAADVRKIESHLYDDVLEVARHPEIRFSGRVTTTTPSGGHVVEGMLTLHGATRSITLTTERAGAFESGELALEQPDFGITPFRAMLGALRVRARVVIRVRLHHASA